MAAPTKPNKVEGAGVAVVVDGRALSRLQSFSTDTDLGVDEVRELTNSNIVEFVEGTPTVTVQLEANMWGRRNNLAAITGMDGTLQARAIAGTAGNEINQFSFDGTSADILVQVEQDSVLARSMYIPAAFVTSLSFGFDVSGSATESYTLESDNREWYWGDAADVIVLSGYYDGATLPSGVRVVANPTTPTTGYWTANTVMGAAGTFKPLFITKNGKKLINPATGSPLASGLYTGGIPANDWVSAPSYDSQFVAGARYRVVGIKKTPSTTIPYTTDTGTTPPSSIGGIRKGMIEIFLVSGSMYAADARGYKEEYLRLQTCSIDADLSREALDELGNSESFYRALNYPISVTVNFSALASDLQEWHAFTDKSDNWNNGDPGPVTTSPTVQFREFVQTRGVLIKIYSDDDTNAARTHLMTITVSGLRVASESFSVDAGGNGVQEFSCTSDNFVVS